MSYSVSDKHYRYIQNFDTKIKSLIFGLWQLKEYIQLKMEL